MQYPNSHMGRLFGFHTWNKAAFNLQVLTSTCQSLISGFCIAPGMTLLTHETVWAMPVKQKYECRVWQVKKTFQDNP